MPEASAINDLYQVVIHSRLENQACENVLDFRTVTPIDDFELRIILALMQCFAAFVPVQPTTFTYTNISWKRTSPTLGIEHITAWTGSASGDSASNALPSFCSVVVSKHTALGGRSHRGRMYLAGIPEDQINQSIMTVPGPFANAVIQLLTCIATKFINFGDPAPVNTAVLGVYSRKLGGAKFPYGIAGFTPCTSLNSISEVGTTRSRKVGRGS